MYLAGLIDNPREVTKEQLESWIKTARTKFEKVRDLRWLHMSLSCEVLT